MRTLIAGGGTGGHLSPALAVAQALRRADPTADLLLVGRRGGFESRMVSGDGVRFATLDVRGVDMARPLHTAGALARVPLAMLEARRLIRHHRADVVVGAGGYVCVPVVAAARQQHIPVVLLEQNAVPGRAVRLLARHVQAVCAAFETTAADLPGARVIATGNPVRPEVTGFPPVPLGERPERLLIMGGSQGARRINRSVAGAVEALLRDHPELSVTHQCGALDAEEAVAVQQGLPAGLRDRYRVAPFFDGIAEHIAAADVVIMRSGGSSLAEVSVLGRPMVLIPYPYAGAHQRDNALPYVDAGAATLIDDAELDAARLRREIDTLLADRTRWRAMADASRRMARPAAADAVVDVLQRLVRRAA